MPQKTDEELRKDRLRFYREEMSEINATLRGFLQRAKASAAFLVDKDGHLITREGVDDKIDVDSICGLVAGAWNRVWQWTAHGHLRMFATNQLLAVPVSAAQIQ